MKVNLLLIACLSGAASAFAPSPLARDNLTQQFMFGGAGGGVPTEDNPEEMKAMEAAAKQLGMTLDEYKLGIAARVRMTAALDKARVTGGSPDKVFVERCGNNPPKYLEITITEAGKALGKEGVSAELCKALKTAADASRSSRVEAQKSMMGYISEEMKKIG